MGLNSRDASSQLGAARAREQVSVHPHAVLSLRDELIRVQAQCWESSSPRASESTTVPPKEFEKNRPQITDL